jgi:hypothetical protein
VTRRSLCLTAAACAVAASAPAGAHAAPVTVSLRVEGPTSTLFEGPVTTDVRPFQFTGDPVAHECDATAAGGGTSAVPVPTRGAAITAASQLAPFAMTGTFNTQFNSPTFDTVAGQSVAFDPATNRFLVEYKNGVSASVGSCGDPISSGDDVVFGYGTGDPAVEHVLKLTGPTTAAPGRPVVVRVANEASGAPLAGAVIEGRASGGGGTISLGPYTARGPHAVKATRSGDIRSNRLTFCVTSGADGACGTTAPAPGAPPAAPCVTTGDDGLCGTADRRAPLGRILSIHNAQKFRRHRGPRLLRGEVAADPSGIAGIRLRLTRRFGGRCSTFAGRKGRFVRIRVCGAVHGRWFPIGTDAQWSFLLPGRLGPGRYVLDVEARDRAGNRDTALVRGRSRAVFRVLRSS